MPDTTPPDDPALITQPQPDEDSAALAAFFDHWKPDLLIWLTGHLRPALLTHCRRLNLPMLLAEAEEDALDEPRWRLRAPQGRRLVAGFHSLFAGSANSARRLQRLGADPAAIAITGPLQEGGTALPCNQAMRDELAAGLAGRPMWLAAMVHPDELEIVLEAQRHESRLAHRLLLILVPGDLADADAMAAVLEAEGLRYLRWSNGDAPREETQVLLADTDGEMGLWYRLSPITFMAGSLKRGLRGHDPFDPAALGSAIIYGPYVAGHMSGYTRLAQAGAARLVRDCDSLQKALGRLIAPDMAASMAAAAWQVSTDGAETTDRVVAWVIDRLDETGAL